MYGIPLRPRVRQGARDARSQREMTMDMDKETIMTTSDRAAELPETPKRGHAETPTWARRFAQRVAHSQETIPDSAMEAEAQVTGAIGLLWSFLDTAVAQANAALADAGVGERITLHRAEDAYRLQGVGWAGEPRSIDVLVSLRVLGAHASGGAQITTSGTRAHIDLVSPVDGTRPRWLIPRTDHELTAHVVDDLLLSVFGDDPAATGRLSPLYSTDQDE